jgi:hypothetical protein
MGNPEQAGSFALSGECDATAARTPAAASTAATAPAAAAPSATPAAAGGARREPEHRRALAAVAGQHAVSGPDFASWLDLECRTRTGEGGRQRSRVHDR